MRKLIVLFLGMVVVVATLSAQYQNATDSQKQEVVGKISQAAGEMNTMQSEFTQVRELSLMDDKITSVGKIYFKKPNKVRLEYTSPYQYAFSIDGQSMKMTSGGQTTTTPTNQSKLFNEISKVLIGGISGSNLVDSPDFDTQFSVGKDDFKVVLVPKKKEVRDLFAAIHLFIGKQDNRIRSIELIEKGGDKTSITLKNLQVNAPIHDDTFK